jgi:hypothetical protein
MAMAVRMMSLRGISNRWHASHTASSSSGESQTLMLMLHRRRFA